MIRKTLKSYAVITVGSLLFALAFDWFFAPNQVAIGGITRENLPELTGCGLQGVAVVSARFGQPDVKAAAQELLALSEQMARS